MIVYSISSNRYGNVCFTDSSEELGKMIQELVKIVPMNTVFVVRSFDMSEEDFKNYPPFDGFRSIQEIPSGTD